MYGREDERIGKESVHENSQVIKICLFQFSERLNEFGLNSSKDIIAATGDGAAVMNAFGNISHFEYFTCFNHTIHLAVLASLFPKKAALNEEQTHAEIVAGAEDIEVLATEHFVMKEAYSEVVERMARIVRFFRNSPVRNDFLQEVSMRLNGKSLQLVMFTRTRWNSMVISAKRFLIMLPAVLSTLEEIGMEGFQWDDSDTQTLKVVI